MERTELVVGQTRNESRVERGLVGGATEGEGSPVRQRYTKFSIDYGYARMVQVLKINIAEYIKNK